MVPSGRAVDGRQVASPGSVSSTKSVGHRANQEGVCQDLIVYSPQLRSLRLWTKGALLILLFSVDLLHDRGLDLFLLLSNLPSPVQLVMERLCLEVIRTRRDMARFVALGSLISLCWSIHYIKEREVALPVQLLLVVSQDSLKYLASSRELVVKVL